MPAFDALTTPIASGDQFTLEIPDGWHQGRGAYGGFSIAAMVRAIESRVADPARRLRSLTVELPGPVLTGSATIDVDVLRTGSSVTTARATLAQADGVKAHAVAVLAAPRKLVVDSWQELVPPSAPPWTSVPAVPHNPAFPEFAQNFELRVVAGIPGQGGAASTIGYVRAREPGSTRDAAYYAALVDVWWPAILVRFRAMRPIATIAYMLELVGDIASVDPDAPVLYRGTVPVMSADGYCAETRELWTTDGRLLARNHQTIAVIA